MAWLSITFEAPAEHVDALSDALLEAGAASVEVTDADAGSPVEQPVFAEPGAAPPRPWQRSRLSVLVAQGASAATIVAAVCSRAGIAPPPCSVSEVAEQDWVKTSRDQFTPIRISPRMWIVPSWHRAPDPEAINISLDPGLAFGTGNHPTTRLCLTWLERMVRGGETVIDYGCGSGILAIAAVKLGAAHAIGVDIDGQALLAARHNAIHNRVQITLHGAADTIRQPAPIVVANILAHPLIVLAPLLARLTARHGRLALAGLLAAQADDVRKAYGPWFDFEVPEEDEGWMLMSCVRR